MRHAVILVVVVLTLCIILEIAVVLVGTLLAVVCAITRHETRDRRKMEE